MVRNRLGGQRGVFEGLERKGNVKVAGAKWGYSKVQTSRLWMLKSCWEDSGWLLKVAHLVVVPRYNSASSHRPSWPLQRSGGEEEGQSRCMLFWFAVQRFGLLDTTTYPPPPICRESVLPFTKYEFSPVQRYTWKQMSDIVIWGIKAK